MDYKSIPRPAEGPDKRNMPRTGDGMDYKKDTTLGLTKELTDQVQVLDTPNEIKVPDISNETKSGYNPRAPRAASLL